ncbi:TIGR04500 family putative peptide maturation system protein [Microbispora sp. KK1-11]|uniref:TIGR04500 family putative peptide maturation system protein n=1 Tax=Microbispora sp. KK1-11 TaxID=2053005 RepID=UPI001159BE14|nr:TIGR04500 family putative peptide maturation system protein [Microbispora sp. KK1-11]TQS28725.1 TIGR04500 family putative peptide maturation system protein [Microbispora sp. KK1-11]
MPPHSVVHSGVLLPPGLLADVLAYLRRIGDLEPDEARLLLAGLRAEHEGVPMRLVWQRDHPGGGCHYDMLIPVGNGTVSVAFAPDRALPWPLRGSRNSGEQVVVRVNGMEVAMEQAMAVLDELWSDASVASRLVDAALVAHELSDDPVDLSPAELQDALDAFRRARGLLTVEATRAWMAERGLDHAGLEHIVAQEAGIARLRRRVAGDRADGLFAADLHSYERLCVLSLRYPRLEAARAAADRLRDGGADPLASAVAETLDHGADARLRRLFRAELGQGAANAAPGDVLGPYGPDPVVTQVVEVRPAVLDDATRRGIEQRLFEDWLAGRRREAHVEWVWGDARRTEAVNQALRAPATGGAATTAR